MKQFGLLAVIIFLGLLSFSTHAVHAEPNTTPTVAVSALSNTSSLVESKTDTRVLHNNSLLDSLRSFGDYLGFTETDPRTIATRLIRTAMSFLGIIFLAMILWSGLKLMVSGGDKEKVDGAKSTFYNALIGIIIVLSAYSIVNFVVSTLTEAGK